MSVPFNYEPPQPVEGAGYAVTHAREPQSTPELQESRKKTREYIARRERWRRGAWERRRQQYEDSLARQVGSVILGKQPKPWAWLRMAVHLHDERVKAKAWLLSGGEWSTYTTKGDGMLVLNRKLGEEIICTVPGASGPVQVVVQVVELRGNSARIGITAPLDVRVDQREVHEARKATERVRLESMADQDVD